MLAPIGQTIGHPSARRVARINFYLSQLESKPLDLCIYEDSDGSAHCEDGKRVKPHVGHSALSNQRRFGHVLKLLPTENL